MNTFHTPRLSVIKIGGNIVEDASRLGTALTAFSQIPGAKIMVHGGGRSATKLAEQLGIEAPLIKGRRITNAEMLKVAVMVYAGWVNKSIVASLHAHKVNAIGLCGADLSVIQAHKRPVKDIDYGFAGDIDSVGVSQLSTLIQSDMVPVLAPITHDAHGQLLNTNADTIAATVAQALGIPLRVHLVYCFELPGVMEDPGDPQSVIGELNPESYQAYQEKGIISGGMIPKLDNAFYALQAGVSRVYICQAERISDLYGSNFHGTIIHS